MANVEWITEKDMRITNLAYSAGVPQSIVLMINEHAIIESIPVAPERPAKELGMVSNSLYWHGRIGERLFSISWDVTREKNDSIILLTNYLGEQNRVGDWLSLLDLQLLPETIYIRRPLGVESRCGDPACAIYRPNPAGWCEVVYKAKSVLDADGLLQFMSKDEWNNNCFAGLPEPRGTWVTVQNNEIIMGHGSTLNVALKFACEWSREYAPSNLTVKDITGKSGLVYQVSDGVVVRT